MWPYHLSFPTSSSLFEYGYPFQLHPGSCEPLQKSLIASNIKGLDPYFELCCQEPNRSGRREVRQDGRPHYISCSKFRSKRDVLVPQYDLRSRKGYCFPGNCGKNLGFGFFIRDDWFLVPEVFHFLLSLAFYHDLSLDAIELFVRTEMKMAKETLIEDQYEEVEPCLRKKQQKAYLLVKDLTAEEQGKSRTVLA